MRPLLALLALTACIQTADQPRADGIYRLISIDGQPFAARATISFPAPDTVAGNAPCNSYGAQLTASLPQFETDGFISTEIACDALVDEGVFFAALTIMTQATVTAGNVTLTNPAGGRMVFVQP